MAKAKKGETKSQNGQEALARALADYQNLLKRVEREKLEIFSRANKNLVQELLPVLDTLERAQSHLKDPGLEMAIQEFLRVLKEAGVERVDSKEGDLFDANLHEAVEIVSGGMPETIARTVQAGYRWTDGMVLRPAKVEVYKGEEN